MVSALFCELMIQFCLMNPGFFKMSVSIRKTIITKNQKITYFLMSCKTKKYWVYLSNSEKNVILYNSEYDTFLNFSPVVHLLCLLNGEWLKHHFGVHDSVVSEDHWVSFSKCLFPSGQYFQASMIHMIQLWDNICLVFLWNHRGPGVRLLEVECILI